MGEEQRSHEQTWDRHFWRNSVASMRLITPAQRALIEGMQPPLPSPDDGYRPGDVIRVLNNGVLRRPLKAAPRTQSHELARSYEGKRPRLTSSTSVDESYTCECTLDGPCEMHKRRSPLSTSLVVARNSSSHLSAPASPETMPLSDAVQRAYGILHSPYLYAQCDAVMCTEAIQRDPYNELYGLDHLRNAFTRHVLGADSQRSPAIERRNNTHFLYHTSVEGSGTRTLIENLCRVHRLNMLHVYTHAPRNLQGIATTIKHESGNYARVVESALRLEPCVVLLDRLDAHFYVMYASTGHELFVAWDMVLARGSVPRVWFIVSSSLSLEDTVQSSPESCFMRLRDTATSAEPLKMDECTNIMALSYGERALERGVLSVDDRPTRPSNGALVPEYNANLAASAYERCVSARRPYLARLAEALYRATEANTPPDAPKLHCVVPWWFDTVVTNAFQRCERGREPTDEQLLEALRRLPLNFAASIQIL